MLVGDDTSIGKDRYGASLSNWFVGMRGRVDPFRGRPREARASIERCIHTARELGQQEVVEWTLAGFVELAVTTGVDDQALTHAQRLLELAEQVGSPFSQSLAHLCIGAAHLVRGEPGAARPPLERAQRDSVERRLARSFQPMVQALLADAYRQMGDPERARTTAQDGVEFARRGSSYCFGLLAELALVRALREMDVHTHRAEIEAGLARCDELLERSQALALEPFIAEERARLAAALGSAEAAELLRIAQKLYAGVDATGHAERVARELERTGT